MDFKEIKGSCACEANRFTLKNKPIAHFICHCEVCQKYTGKAFSDVFVFLKRDISKLDITETEFKKYKRPPNIQRGKCKKCHQPSIEFGIFDQLAFIPAMNIQNHAQLGAPSMHIFYHRSVEKIEDDLPKYRGFVLSQTKVSMLIMKGILQHLNS